MLRCDDVPALSPDPSPPFARPDAARATLMWEWCFPLQEEPRDKISAAPVPPHSRLDSFRSCATCSIRRAASASDTATCSAQSGGGIEGAFSRASSASSSRTRLFASAHSSARVIAAMMISRWLPISPNTAAARLFWHRLISRGRQDGLPRLRHRPAGSPGRRSQPLTPPLCPLEQELPRPRGWFSHPGRLSFKKVELCSRS